MIALFFMKLLKKFSAAGKIAVGHARVFTSL